MWLNLLTVRLRPMWRMYWDLDLAGDVDAIPRDGGLLVTPNHSSFIDPWFLSITFPRPVYHLINRDWYERSPFWKWFFDANGTVPISSNDPDQTLASIRGIVDAGHAISVFPEGRISHDGRMQRFRSGIAWFAAATGAPVLPVGIRGAYEVSPRTSRFPKRGRVRVVAGAPMRFPGAPVDGTPPPREVVRFKNALQERVRDLAGQSGAPESGAAVDVETTRVASV